jgi:bifunctional non-homologous end joining protein LigD
MAELMAPTTGRLPKQVKPMLLTEVKDAFNDEDWTFELKLDGIRLLAWIDRDQVTLYTRNDRDVSDRFPDIVEELRKLNLRETILDGEVVLLDEKGLPNFQRLAGQFKGSGVRSGVYFLFDLLFSAGEDLRSERWSSRRSRLEQIKPAGPRLRVLDEYPGDGKLLYSEATRAGFEGIVGKRLDSRYESGVRSHNWVKVKGYHSDEFVVGGYLKGNGARANTFGSLAVGRPGQNGLQYVGNVGGGFDVDELTRIAEALSELRTTSSPFDSTLPVQGVQFVKPSMIVEVRFQAFTEDGRLRFPIYLRSRLDLAAGEL